MTGIILPLSSLTEPCDRSDIEHDGWSYATMTFNGRLNANPYHLVQPLPHFEPSLIHLQGTSFIHIDLYPETPTVVDDLFRGVDLPADLHRAEYISMANRDACGASRKSRQAIRFLQFALPLMRKRSVSVHPRKNAGVL